MAKKDPVDNPAPTQQPTVIVIPPRRPLWKRLFNLTLEDRIETAIRKTQVDLLDAYKGLDAHAAHVEMLNNRLNRLYSYCRKPAP